MGRQSTQWCWITAQLYRYKILTSNVPNTQCFVIGTDGSAFIKDQWNGGVFYVDLGLHYCFSKFLNRIHRFGKWRCVKHQVNISTWQNALAFRYTGKLLYSVYSLMVYFLIDISRLYKMIWELTLFCLRHILTFKCNIEWLDDIVKNKQKS